MILKAEICDKEKENQVKLVFILRSRPSD